MSESIAIERIVEKAISRIFESRIPALCEELVRNVVAELLPELAKSRGELAGSDDAQQNGTPADLLAAISAIHSGSTQKEILRALLDNTIRYSGRGALFVIKSGIATGWKGRGFDNSDAIKDFSLDLRSGVAANAMRTRSACSGTAAEVDPRFVTHFRAPADGQVLFLPLLLKDKIAALVYADAGVNPGGRVDSAAMEVVVTATSAWLELVSLRKQAHKEGASEFADRPEQPAPAAAVDSSIRDPFASHAPTHAPVAQQSAATGLVDATTIETIPMTMAASASNSAFTATSSKPEPVLSAADQDVHLKAQRFARLLIDEIKLYNQATVDEGRQHHDLYDRLKEDIEKSRITYQKRYGSTVASDGNYFNQELVRILAEDNVSLLGVNYPH